ncbi:MAG TPA: SRPBCC domain-containing protein [Chloroflexota bacterium]|jgi:uncharacterized protein YndB with AHSA1/START domain|nr:SRPBCC domain-containing protein [Chloroflexota bacterium]
MPIRRDESGRRYVQAEVEVPGSPEEVWNAIASGPGISSWFVPTTVEERPGGTSTSSFGPGMDSSAIITEWNPPRRFVAESRDDTGPGAPTVATEWIVEARSGGTCTVRVVHSWFADTDDWDSQFEGHEFGWQGFFKILRLYLEHFSGQPCSAFQVMGVSQEPIGQAWQTFTHLLGVDDMIERQAVVSAAGAPTLSAVVEDLGPVEFPSALLRLTQPAPGLAHFFPIQMDQVYVSVRVFLYGPRGAEVASDAELAWQAWMAEHFPLPDRLAS